MRTPPSGKMDRTEAVIGTVFLGGFWLWLLSHAVGYGFAFLVLTPFFLLLAFVAWSHW